MADKSLDASTPRKGWRSENYRNIFRVNSPARPQKYGHWQKQSKWFRGDPPPRLPSLPHSLPQNCNICLVSTWRETLEWFSFQKSSFIKLLSFVSNRFRRELCEMLLCFHVLMTETMSLNFLFYERIRHQISLHMPRPHSALINATRNRDRIRMDAVPSCVRFSLKSRASSKKVLEYEKINLLINIRIYFMFCSPHFLPHSTLPVFTQSVFMSSASTVWWSCRRMNEKRQQQRASLKMWVKLKIIVWNSAFCASTATDEHGNCRDKKKLKKHIHNGIH